MLLVVLFSFSHASEARFEGVCRTAIASGHDSRANNAKLAFSTLGILETNNVSHMVIYVEKYPGNILGPEGFYYHTNYVRKGDIFPVKVVGNISNIRLAVENAIYDSRFEADLNLRQTDAAIHNLHLVIHEDALVGSNGLNLKAIDGFTLVKRTGEYVSVKRAWDKESCFPDIGDPCKELESRREEYLNCKDNLSEGAIEISALLLSGVAEAMGCKPAKR
ncbi:hypothetical protein [Ferrimonas balearica]|uniref:hypothetical protein n=1 Tax=Ferrimonas balearica TaxID=44012 RepID=UPI001C9A2127|nr:hypothetical protein [Ferrimonas balearica]MBY5920801.1 hypothetical protein [Ferrimonas balearica]MBY5996514.1 hypothetical protein [Ferrimonas balearica]